MKSSFYHLQLNVDFERNSSFYKELMEFLGWEAVFEGDDMSGYKSSNGVDMWFINSARNRKQEYDDIGVNHISIKVENQSDVDQVASFLESKSIKTMFETPKHRPDFAASEAETYYQIMFETPDKILFEIVYTGLK